MTLHRLNSAIPQLFDATSKTYEEEYTLAASAGGENSASAIAATAVSIVFKRKGNQVTMFVPTATAAGQSAAKPIPFTTAIPARFRPAADQLKQIIVNDNALAAGSCGVVAETGVITVYDGLGAGNFTSGTDPTGWKAFDMTWLV